MIDPTLNLSVSPRIWLGIPGLHVDTKTCALLEEIQPGGIILFSRNIKDPIQVARLTSDLRQLLGSHLHICIDQEGGRVVRFPDGLTFFPGNLALGSMAMNDFERASQLAWLQGWYSGEELSDLGIDVNLAPCVDLLSSPESRGIGSRSFGSQPEIAGQLASEIGAGHRAAGVHDCWKHFPGLGRVKVDPHFGLPVTPKQGSENDLLPFLKAAVSGASIVMTSHVIAEAFDAQQPVTTSKTALRSLREDLGFTGVIMTDCIEMGGVSDQPVESVVKGAIEAGHDIILVSHTPDIQRRVYRHLLEIIPEDSPEHIEALKRVSSLSKERSSSAVFSAEEKDSRVPDLSASEVAREICRGGVSLLSGDLPECPLIGDWLLMTPETLSGSPVEDPLPVKELDLLFQNISACSHKETISVDLDNDRIHQVLDVAKEYDGVILAVKGIRHHPQLQYFKDLCTEMISKLVIVLLEDPRDLQSLNLETPSRNGIPVLCAHGGRSLHLETLAEVLEGKLNPTRSNPID